MPTSEVNMQAQLYFRDDQQRMFGISNISNYFQAGLLTPVLDLAQVTSTAKVFCG